MTDDDLIEAFLAAQAAFTERVHAVAGEQWQLGTPDTEWTVADLTGHLVDEHRWAGPLLDGLGMAAAGVAVAARWEPPGRDGTSLVPGWDEAAARSAAAVRADRALAGSVEVTRGRAPAVEYLEEMALDLVIHAWDLGTAIGYSEPLPTAAVTAIYPLAQAIVDRTPAGMFAPPAEAGADAPLIDRLVALTGRRPR
jgi:uncharacterized protein (TIGR03086 family)